MTPEEIRAMQIGANSAIEAMTPAPEVALNIILRELTAQIAEANQHMRKRGEKKAKPGVTNSPVRSASRSSSSEKRFFVAHWGSAVEISMLPPFTPMEGFKSIEDLQIHEQTQGHLGTVEDAKITRRL